MQGCFFSKVWLYFVVLFMTKLPFQNRRSSECIFLHWFTVAWRCMRKKGQGGLSKVLQLSRGLVWKISTVGILRKLIIQRAFLTLTHDLFTDLFLSLSHEFFITHRITPPHFFMHTPPDRYALFLQDPADAAETVELVSLVNKQCEAAGSLHWASKL